MHAALIAAGLYSLAVGPVNTFFLDSSDGCVLIDAGFPSSAQKILQAIQELGKQPKDVRHIILTHAHPDHIGSFAALKKATGADAYMHPLDAPIAIAGTGFRRLYPAPGLFSHIAIRALALAAQSVEPASIEHEVRDGDVLPIAGGLTAIHVPGHCAGQIALLWPQHGGVLFAVDTCAHMMGLGLSIGYEDLEEGKRSLKKLAQLDFQIACFGHGKPIMRNASSQFRAKWG
jgi:glyoxylase-like metal-dependent hydrolase (beta-lactamase superfamily II)